MVDELKRLKTAEGRQYSDFALLYRTNAQSRSFEEVLIQNGIPYRVIGGFRFYERKEIKDILLYLRLVYNPQDRVSLARVINVPKRGIGDASFERFLFFLDDNNYSVIEGFEHIEEIPSLTARGIKPLQDFYRMLDGWIKVRDQKTVTELSELILKESGYLQDLRNETTIEAQGRLENLEEFLALTVEFERNSDDKTLAAFLETVALVADVDEYQAGTDSVVMMTLHSAKGLEFPVVFLVGLEEGLFPHSRALMETADLEEERRLCYVGITRAKQLLYITYANMRTIYGSLNAAIPSRFLMELPKETIINLKANLKSNKPKSNVTNNLNNPTAAKTTTTVGVTSKSDPDTIRPGCKVNHVKWGVGTIISKEGNGPNAQVKVAFPGLGIKSLILEYANLELIQ